MEVAWKSLYLVLIFSFFNTATTIYAGNGVLVRRSTVPVKFGSKDCISNCSRLSSAGDVFMQCSVNECKQLEKSPRSAQPCEINNKKDIHIEKFYDGKEEKLALYIRWSPVDNVSAKETSGYLINITDGSSSYSSCYSFLTKMSFHDNSHDKYYNDCFGKVPGTKVIPGSDITVRISVLPLYQDDHTDSMVTRKIQVPNCSNEMLCSLPICKRMRPGGCVTTKKCISETCHTASDGGNSRHEIECSVSQYEFGQAGPEKCVNINRTVTGKPSKPVHMKQEQEWYKYQSKGEVKLALNFSWGPSPDSSIESLTHYYIEIMVRSKSSLANFDVCYSVHTQLVLRKHRNATFYYDCYGRDDHSRIRPVEPGHEYHVHVESKPSSKENHMNFTINIPDCRDERMHDVTACKDYDSIPTIHVLDKFCENKTIKVNYTLSKNSGPDAKIYVCESGQGLQYCERQLNVQRNLEKSGILYVAVPSSTEWKRNLSVIVDPDHELNIRAAAFTDFSSCFEEEGGPMWIMILIFIVGVLVVFALLGIFCYFVKDGGTCKEFQRCLRQQHHADVLYVQPGEEPTVSHLHPQADPSTPPRARRLVRVYVVFKEDHHLHTDVVHWFCSYLKKDLGLDVRVSMWEEEVVATNKVMYMKTNLEHADKVIIICSAGTQNCLKMKYDEDMFTPVVRDVCNQSFLGKDPGKFLVAYFPYSSAEHVPEMLEDQCLMYFSLFHLMKQFEQFYFRLVGVEQYQEGGIQRIEKIAFDRYYDPKLTTYGEVLKQKIDAMVDFKTRNPNWYSDLHGSDIPGVDIPPAPRCPGGSKSILEVDSSDASITHLIPNPPQQLSQPLGNRKISNEEPARCKDGKHVYMSIPTEHREAGYQPLSEDDSFILQPDTDHSSSMESHNPGNPNDPHRKQSGYPIPRNDSVDHTAMSPHSFHPESFKENDFGLDDTDSDSMESRQLVSNVTEMTVLGLTESQKNLVNPQEENLLAIPPLMQDASPNNGKFTLINIDDGDNDVDIEKEFKSINFDSHNQSDIL